MSGVNLEGGDPVAKKLAHLTPQQLDQLVVYRDRWTRIGLATGPLDRQRAQTAVCAVYRAAGLQPPRHYFYASSPIGGALMAALLQFLGTGGHVRDQVWDQVWDHVRDQIWDHVRGHIENQVWNQVRDQVWDHLRGQVWGHIENQVWNQVWNQVREQVQGHVWDQVEDHVWDQVRGYVRDHVRDHVWSHVWDQVRGYVRDHVRAQIYGSIDAPWLSFHGLWAPYRGLAILQDRPIIIARDDRGRLHHDTGMAVQYPDSWGLYAWHGVLVPPKVILHPESLTVEEIAAEQNAEIQCVMVERRSLYA